MVLKDLLYTETHEWVKVEGEEAYIGITDYAQHELGDIVYVELPEEGDQVESGEAFGTIEAVKAVEDQKQEQQFAHYKQWGPHFRAFTIPGIITLHCSEGLG